MFFVGKQLSGGYIKHNFKHSYKRTQSFYSYKKSWIDITSVQFVDLFLSSITIRKIIDHSSSTNSSYPLRYKLRRYNKHKCSLKKKQTNASIEYININFIIPIYSNSQDIYMQSKTLHLESLNQKYTPYMPVVSNKSPTQTRQHAENFKLATCSINCCIECYKEQAVTYMLDIHM